MIVSVPQGGMAFKQAFLNPVTDGLRVEGSHTRVIGCTFYDHSTSQEAHNDAIQLLPKYPNFYNTQYAAAEIEDVLLSGNQISAPRSKQQGIFASDGLFFEVNILNNTIRTESQHKVTINGLVSGCISGNTNGQGMPVDVVLNPLRIGGAVNGHCVWVVGFNAFEYAPILGCESLTDNRTKTGLRKGDTYLHEFEVEGFREAVLPLLRQNLQVHTLCSQLQKLALDFGKVV